MATATQRDSICPWCFTPWKIDSGILGDATMTAFLQCTKCGAEVIIVKPQKQREKE
jgi:hypothetical protein